MALLEHYHTRFEEEGIYHVYNRVVDRKRLFTKKWNYDYFMLKLIKYLIPIVDIYAFCLLHNHFHILLKVKALQKDLSTLKELTNLNQDLPINFDGEIGDLGLLHFKENKKNQCHYIVSQAFKKMFQSYAMAFNRQEDRIGTLFQTPFKRSEVGTDEYLAQLIYYIHSNPQKHKIASDFRRYPYSSYRLYKRKEIGDLAHQEVYDFFGGYKKFMEFHSHEQNEPILKYIIENE